MCHVIVIVTGSLRVLWAPSMVSLDPLGSMCRRKLEVSLEEVLVGLLAVQHHLKGHLMNRLMTFLLGCANRTLSGREQTMRRLPLLESRLMLSWNANPSPIPFRRLFLTPRLSSRLIASRSLRMMPPPQAQVTHESAPPSDHTGSLQRDPVFDFSHFPSRSGR